MATWRIPSGLRGVAALTIVSAGLLTGFGASAQDDDAAALAAFERAREIYLDAGGLTGDADRLAEVRALLDTILADYPTSDLAAAIRTGLAIDGVDIAGLDSALTEETQREGITADEDVAGSSEEMDDAGEPDDTASATEARAAADAARARAESDAAAAKLARQTAEAAAAAAAARAEEAAKAEAAAREAAAAEARAQAILPFAEFSEELSECYFGDAELPENARIVMSFELDSERGLRGIPTPTEAQSDEIDASARRLYILGLLALENCNPYDADLPPGSYEVEVEPTAIAALLPDVLPKRLSDPATEEDETALELSRSDRREIQVRLDLLGHDPGEKDGVLGPRSRSAIEAFQISAGIPPTGFLSAVQINVLVEQSQTAYEGWLEQERRARPRLVRVCRRTFLGLDTCRNEYR